MNTDQTPPIPQERLGAEIVPVYRTTTRRGFLKVAGIATAVIGGSIALDEVLHKPPKPHDPLPALPTAKAGPLLTGSFVSARRGNVATGYAVAFPPGEHPNPLPVLVALHAAAGSYSSAFTDLHLQTYLAAEVGAGTPPFAIASVDGGAGDYWHKRKDTDPAGMVVEEFLPLLAGLGLDTGRPAFLGWAMGGYGALYLATLLRGRTASAGALSPAIWQHYAQAASGAFDGAADFAANSIFDRLPLLAGIPLRVDCADQDPYLAGTRALRAAVRPTPAGGIERGYGDVGYWLREVPAHLAFAGSRLASARAATA